MVNAVLLTSAEEKDLIDGKNKAFMYIAGRRVFEYALDALYHSENIERIYILGPKQIEEGKKTLTLESLIENYRSQHAEKPIIFQPETEDKEPWRRFHGNITLGFNLARQTNSEVLFAPSDIPLANKNSIDYFIANCSYFDAFCHNDLYYCIVNNDRATRAYHQHIRKPYILREGNFRPGNLTLVKPSGIKNTELLAKAFIHSRKLSRISSQFKLAWHVGMAKTAKQWLLLISGMSTIKGLENYLSKAVEASVKLVDVAAPELEYDIDDKNDFDNIKRIIEDRKRYTQKRTKVS